MGYRRYYVYSLIDPRSNTIFYIGKGKGKRAWNHLCEHENINEAKQKKIKEIKESGFKVGVKIIQDNLLEVIAYRVESFLINNLPNLTNIVKPKYDAKILDSGKLEDAYRIEEVLGYE